MPDPSFDVVSEIDHQEVRNAVDQAGREIANRYDFKGTDTTIELTDDTVTITSATDNRVQAAHQVLSEKFAKRKISQKALQAGKIEPAAGGRARQTITLVAGIDKERSKKITKLVKDQKRKVQASVQGDRVRISGKKKDDLQAVMQALREADIDIPLQFVNMR